MKFAKWCRDSEVSTSRTDSDGGDVCQDIECGRSSGKRSHPAKLNDELSRCSKRCVLDGETGTRVCSTPRADSSRWSWYLGEKISCRWELPSLCEWTHGRYQKSYKDRVKVRAFTRAMATGSRKVYVR